VRKIKSHFFISLDGVVEAPDKWHFPYFDDEMGAAVGAGFATTEALLMGRVLYEEWAAYWPEHADEPFGDVMNSMKKYVVSSGLHEAAWQNSEVISGDVAGKLADIKAQDGGDITMSGSATTSAGCCARASSTSSTCSCTRSWSATAWPGCSRRTSRASRSSS
jgi:dihydrofolate reductase